MLIFFFWSGSVVYLFVDRFHTILMKIKRKQINKTKTLLKLKKVKQKHDLETWCIRSFPAFPPKLVLIRFAVSEKMFFFQMEIHTDAQTMTVALLCRSTRQN